jgi:hypothetical protein
MASGDDIRAGRITAAEKDDGSYCPDSDRDHPLPFDSDVIFRVGPQKGGVVLAV